MARDSLVISARAGDVARVMKKLDAKYLVEPEMEAAIDRIATEMKTRHDKRKGLGARRNRMEVERLGRLARRVTSTPLVSQWKPKKAKGGLFRTSRAGTPRPGWQEKVPNYNPRRTGVAWHRAQQKRWKGMLPNVLNKAVKAIEARWAS